MTKKTIIVIPGLGSEASVRRTSKIIHNWNDADYRVRIFDSKWSEDETFGQKFVRLLKFYDSYSGNGISVVAYSAGGALAISLYGQRLDIENLILVSGKLKGSTSIGQNYQDRAPALVDAVRASEKVIKHLSDDRKHRIACYVPLVDEVVPKSDMTIQGSRKKIIPFVSHVGGIGFALLFQVARAIKKDE